MAGLDVATHGRVFIGDTDLTRLDDKRLTHFRVSVVIMGFRGVIRGWITPRNPMITTEVSGAGGPQPALKYLASG